MFIIQYLVWCNFLLIYRLSIDAFFIIATTSIFASIHEFGGKRRVYEAPIYPPVMKLETVTLQLVPHCPASYPHLLFHLYHHHHHHHNGPVPNLWRTFLICDNVWSSIKDGSLCSRSLARPSHPPGNPPVDDSLHEISTDNSKVLQKPNARGSTTFSLISNQTYQPAKLLGWPCLMTL